MMQKSKYMQTLKDSEKILLSKMYSLTRKEKLQSCNILISEAQDYWVSNKLLPTKLEKLVLSCKNFDMKRL